VQHPLDVESNGAESFLGIVFPGQLRIAFEDQAQVLDVTAEGIIVVLYPNAVLPVIRGAEIAV